MEKTIDKTTRQALVLGMISGTRATLATTIAAHYLSKNPGGLKNTRLGFIHSPAATIVTKVLTATEMAGDKLPNIPDRTIPPALLARVASGALAGATVATANNGNITKGIVIGSAAALASTFLWFYLRKKISGTGLLKEPWPGVVEDVVAIGSGVLAMR